MRVYIYLEASTVCRQRICKLKHHFSHHRVVAALETDLAAVPLSINSLPELTSTRMGEPGILHRLLPWRCLSQVLYISFRQRGGGVFSEKNS